MHSFLKNKAGIFGTLIVLAAMFSSCHDPYEGPGKKTTKGETVEVGITLGVKAPTPRTRAGDAVRQDFSVGGADGITVSHAASTRAGGLGLTEEQETMIHNLWVLQFDDTGGKLASQYIIDPERVDTGDAVYYKTPVELEETGTTPTTLFFIANAGAAAGFDAVGDLAAFKALNRVFANENAVSGESDTPGGILMSGRWHTDSGLTSSTDITAEVERLAAKFTVHLVNRPAPELMFGLTINSVQVQSVANRVSYYNFAAFDNNASWTYPDAAVAGNFLDYNIVDADLQDGSDEDGSFLYRDFTWYAVENRQGANTEILNQKNKWRETDPSFLATGTSRSTRIVVKGEYSDMSGDDYVPPRGVTITVYPGEDNYRNFDVVRNTDYVMNIIITKLDDDDKRVEFDPLVTFKYYYVDPDMGGEPTELTKDSHSGMEAGAPYIGNAGFPELDYTTPEVLNFHKDLLPEPDDFEDGVVEGTPPTVVSLEDDENTVNIYYYKKTAETGYKTTVKYVLYKVVEPGGGVDGDDIWRVDYDNPLGTFTVPEKAEGYVLTAGTDFPLDYDNSYGSPLPVGYTQTGFVDEYNGLGTATGAMTVTADEGNNVVYVVLHPTDKTLVTAYTRLFQSTDNNYGPTEYPILDFFFAFRYYSFYCAVGDRFYPFDPLIGNGYFVVEGGNWGEPGAMGPGKTFENIWNPTATMKCPAAIWNRGDKYVTVVANGNLDNNLNTIGYFYHARNV